MPGMAFKHLSAENQGRVVEDLTVNGFVFSRQFTKGIIIIQGIVCWKKVLFRLHGSIFEQTLCPSI